MNPLRQQILDDLQRLEAECTITSSDRTTGYEWEVGLFDPSSPKPAANAKAIASEVQFTTPEIGSQTLELLSPAFQLNSDAFYRLERFQHQVMANAISASSRKARLVPCPLLPVSFSDLLSIGTDHSWLTPKQRGHDLNELIDQHLGYSERPKHYLTNDGETLSIVAGCSALNSVNASFQVHLGGGISDVVKWLNLGLAISAPIEAMAARSPFLAGHAMQWDCMRSFLSIDSIDSYKKTQQDKGLYRWGPGRYLNENNALSEILGLYQNWARTFPLLLKDYKSIDGEFPSLSLLIGHCWQNIARPVFSRRQNGQIQFRLEFRFLPSACPRENTINAFALICAILGLANSNSGSNICSYEEARANYWRAAESSLNADLVLKGRFVSVREFWREVLFPAIQLGAKQLDVDPGDIGQYLDSLQNALDKGRATILRKKAKGLTPDEVRELELKAYSASLKFNQPIEEVI